MATFGDTTVYALGLTPINAIENFLSQLITPADCNSIQSIHFYGAAVGGPASMEALVYADLAGMPAALVGSGTPGGTLVAAGIAQWHMDPIICPVTPSTVYWFGFLNADLVNGITLNTGVPGLPTYYNGPDPAYPPPSDPEAGMGMPIATPHGLYVTYARTVGGRKDNTLKRLKQAHFGGM